MYFALCRVFFALFEKTFLVKVVSICLKYQETNRHPDHWKWKAGWKGKSEKRMFGCDVPWSWSLRCIHIKLQVDGPSGHCSQLEFHYLQKSSNPLSSFISRPLKMIHEVSRLSKRLNRCLHDGYRNWMFLHKL